MINHPHRSRGPYTAEIGGSSWSRGPVVQFATIRECREWAEKYGTIIDSKGRVVGSHRRNPNGDGTGWYRATV